MAKLKLKKTVKWKITQEEFLEKIPSEFLTKIDILGQYKSQHDRIDVKCRFCNRIWSSTPYYLYRKYGCDKCKRKQKGIASRKSQKTFVAEVEAAHDGCISVVGTYITGKSRIKAKCLQCDCEWNPVAQRLLHRGCPSCISSKGERRIKKFLLENQVSFKEQFGFDDFRASTGCKYRFDFAVFKNEILSHLIEYDGQQHFKPIQIWGGIKRYKKQIEIDQLKNRYCETNNIRLIRIPYTQFAKLNYEMLT